MTEVVIIAAVAANGVIGATVDGRPSLPWRLPEDLKRFKVLTSGHPVIMGRKTWESIGRPLPGRRNIVVTRQAGYRAGEAEVAGSLDAALAACADAPIAFVIGGAELYAQALPRADRLELTEIGRAFEGDTRFPDVDHGRWCESARETFASAAGLPFAFVTYRLQKQS